MKKTANYQLNQWEAADPVQRTDFNADNAAIDAAIKAAEQAAANALAAYQSTTDAKLTDLSTDRIYFGSWVGDGTTYRSIQLPFEPRFILVLGHLYSNGLASMVVVATQDCQLYIGPSGCNEGSQNWGGALNGDLYQMGQYSSWNNYNGETVHYMAIR